MKELDHQVLRLMGAERVLRTEKVQTLWSGYGEIVRYHLAGGPHEVVIVKHIRWPEGQQKHPRGWNTDLGHERKLKSYQIEQCWYTTYAARTTADCRVPELYHALALDSEVVLVMEDLNASGYALRRTPEAVSIGEVKRGLRWLAHFHGAFLGVNPAGLWPLGTYWHLATRPEEWARMQNAALKEAAEAIDERLSAARYQTLVHGDAKLANFCFGAEGEIAAVDFQYVGGGCGMKDVAYFISSCLEETDCERHETELLAHYFQHLQTALRPDVDFEALEVEWRGLYAFAWADFYRFLDGWSPGHWKMHDYSEKLTQMALRQLGKM